MGLGFLLSALGELFLSLRNDFLDLLVRRFEFIYPLPAANLAVRICIDPDWLPPPFFYLRTVPDPIACSTCRDAEFQNNPLCSGSSTGPFPDTIEAFTETLPSQSPPFLS